MKRVTLFLIAFALSLSAFAQEGHILFKDVPVTGTVYDFTEKMEKEGYVLNSVIDGIVLMRGKFAGNNCNLYLVPTPTSETVWKVMVAFDSESSWYSLKRAYEDLKGALTAKFGKPAKDHHSFVSPYRDGDGFELLALSLSKALYAVLWETDNGAILLRISATSSSSGWISINYEDEAGVALNRKEKNTIISSDL